MNTMEDTLSFNKQQIERPIGIMDSGVGGISVLRELVKLMPGEDYIYYGDSVNAPYGTKPAQELIDLTMKNARFLLEQGAKAIVIACNTATSVAANILRETYPEIPIIGIEPALKPAVLAKEHSKVLVMATIVTLEQKKFGDMMHLYEEDADIIKMPCPGLVELIESGHLKDQVLLDYLEEKFSVFHKEEIDAVVLGCTHYPLIKNMVQSIVPNATIYDGGYGTARQTERRLEECGLLSQRETGGQVVFYNSLGTEEMLDFSRYLLELSE
ncbi:MAG: glutamate racemase [Lachnospiraceae bacterium]|nr:glutamate racemase [Lachnospiraceae bacterium]